MHSTTAFVYKGHGLQREEAILPPVSGPYWEPCFQFLPGLSSHTAAVSSHRPLYSDSRSQIKINREMKYLDIFHDTEPSDI